jgi:DMSO reductase anchor subunit
LTALIASLLGLAGSTLHLGQPRKAWRAFLGLRRSWLSREIIVFGAFAFLAAITTFSIRLRSTNSILLAATAVTGLLGVFCSGMTYHVTHRECWRGELSIGRFFGTTAILGSAAAWCVTVLSHEKGAAFAVMLALATAIKLSRELAFLRLCPDDADRDYELPAGLRARNAFTLRFRLGQILRMRLACAWGGGVFLPLLAFLPALAPQAIAISALLLCLAGELIERFLFFRAVAVSRMPGTVNT